MEDPRTDPAETMLTERQHQVLVLRNEGLTQPEIADQFGTSVANVSSIEKRARENIARAGRTIALAKDIQVDHWVSVPDGTHLRELVETIYDAGDEVGVKVPYTAPELTTYLHVHLRDRLDGRRLTQRLQIGLTPTGEVVTRPSEFPSVPID